MFTSSLCLCTAIVAGGKGGNRLGLVALHFSCTLGPAPALTLVAAVDMDPRVVGSDAFPVKFVSVVAIEVIRDFVEEGKGGRATGVIVKGGERRVDVVEAAFVGASADTESFVCKVGEAGKGCRCELEVGRGAVLGEDNCSGGISLIGGGEMTFLEYWLGGFTVSSDRTVSVGDVRFAGRPTIDAGGDVGGDAILKSCPVDMDPALAAVPVLGKGYSLLLSIEGPPGLIVGLRGDEYTDGGLGLVLTSGLNFTLVI